MHAHLDAASPPASRAADADALLAQLLAGPAGSAAPASARAPWAAPARLAPARAACAAGPTWPAARTSARRPIAAAATLLLAGGLVASSVGAVPARAAQAPAGAAHAAPVSVAAQAPLSIAAPARARGALAGLRVASAAPSDAAVLARLLAAPTDADAALLTALLAAPAAPAGIPAFELADAPAADAAAPAPVSFGTVTRLPSTAFSYTPAAVALPAVTVEEQRRSYVVVPPPAPPAPAPPQQQQPPPPAGYVQPPGYQDGVPFGGQIGAVPGSRPTTPSRPTRPTTRPTVSVTYTVRAGDTLSSIAVRYYGDARYAAVIWEANYRVIGANPNAIFPGQRLTLPGVAGRPAVGAPLPTGPINPRSNYTIQPRDFLRWMAQRAYGNEMLWPEIYHANRNVLGANPDLIYPNVTVYIP